MQHYRCPTRLVDFTSDLWQALFFAMERPEKGDDSEYGLIYRFKCKNEDHQNKGGNKLPRNIKNETPHSPGLPSLIDINEFLGRIIGYGEFYGSLKWSEPELQKWSGGEQRFGWDQPAYMNARMARQRGFFMYSVDAQIPLEDAIGNDKNLTKFRVRKMPEIRNEIKKRGLNPWTVYLDLEKAFKSFLDELL